MTKRINKAIELLQQGQPVFATYARDLSYEGGKALARTWADWIRVNMEHNGFDLPGLSAFMRGLADGGPTNSGHRTPAVTVELPVEGYSAAEIRANAWMIKLVLGAGVHGILLCHAETPKAVRALVEVCRFPLHTQGVGEGLARGRRGAGGEGSAAPVWGLSPLEYREKADVWPLNPNGELMLGLKIETRGASAIADRITKVPGIAFAEWGPGDMHLSFGYLEGYLSPYPKDVAAARARVMAACAQDGLAFLHGVREDDVIAMLEAGIMMCDPIGPAAEAIAAIGRAHAGRTMPV